jgi:hypothetical protein
MPPADDTSAQIVAPKQAITPKANTPKIGDPGQPTVQEWHAEIKRDLKLALGKMQQMPPSGKKIVNRVMRAIQVHLVT